MGGKLWKMVKKPEEGKVWVDLITSFTCTYADVNGGFSLKCACSVWMALALLVLAGFIWMLE